MDDLLEHFRKLALREPRSTLSIRVMLAVKAALVLAVMALAHEQPSVLLVALAPLALVAAEAARHLGGLDEPEDG